MKTVIYYSSFTLLCLSLLFLNSCNKVDGEGIPPKFPELTTIEKEGGDIIIKAKNNVYWSFTDLKINDVETDWDDESITYYTSEFDKELSDDKHGHSRINKFEGEWYTLEKIGNNKLKISLKENELDKDRTLSFTAFAGNASSKVLIVQNSN